MVVKITLVGFQSLDNVQICKKYSNMGIQSVPEVPKNGLATLLLFVHS